SAAVLAVGWLSLGASGVWVGHLSDIVGSVGKIGSTFGSNVTSRVTGSASHRLVVDLRILLTAALFGLAVIGSLRRATETRTLEFLVGSPFLLLAFQNYGGEVLIRVVLFGLPFTSLLAASAILPNRSGAVAPLIPRVRRRLRAPAVLGLTVAVTLFGFALLTTGRRCSLCATTRQRCCARNPNGSSSASPKRPGERPWPVLHAAGNAQSRTI